MFRKPPQSNNQNSSRYLCDADTRFCFDPNTGVYVPKTYYEQKNSHDKKKSSLSGFEWGSLLLNLLTLITVGFYTHYARLQWCEMQRTNNIAKENQRIDQRPWVGGIPPLEKGFPFTVGKEISMPMTIKNFGKTVALSPKAFVRVYILKMGENPEFVYTAGHASTTTQFGMLFPGESRPVDFPGRTHGIEHAEPIIARQDLGIGLKTGNLWVAAFGVITYSDVFGGKHWTHFCYGAGDPRKGSPKCIQYNAVGDGDPPEELPPLRE